MIFFVDNFSATLALPDTWAHKILKDQPREWTPGIFIFFPKCFSMLAPFSRWIQNTQPFSSSFMCVGQDDRHTDNCWGECAPYLAGEADEWCGKWNSTRRHSSPVSGRIRDAALYYPDQQRAEKNSYMSVRYDFDLRGGDTILGSIFWYYLLKQSITIDETKSFWKFWLSNGVSMCAIKIIAFDIC